MAYVGGKAKAHFIIDVLNDPRFDNYVYYEPFVGMGHILWRVKRKHSYMASDVKQLLIRLLAGVQANEALPIIEKSEYNQLKHGTDISLKRACACYQWSFSGKEWGGWSHTYQRRDGRIDNMVESRARYYDKLRASSTFQQAQLHCIDYRELHPVAGALIYCDPP